MVEVWTRGIFSNSSEGMFKPICHSGVSEASTALTVLLAATTWIFRFVQNEKKRMQFGFTLRRELFEGRVPLSNRKLP